VLSCGTDLKDCVAQCHMHTIAIYDCVQHLKYRNLQKGATLFEHFHIANCLRFGMIHTCDTMVTETLYSQQDSDALTTTVVVILVTSLKVLMMRMRLHITLSLPAPQES
jgi:hypothetical protein